MNASKLFIFLPCPLAGIVKCIVTGCDERVTTHALYQTSKGAVLPSKPLYWCVTHTEAIAKYVNSGDLQGVQAYYLLGEETVR